MAHLLLRKGDRDMKIQDISIFRVRKIIDIWSKEI